MGELPQLEDSDSGEDLVLPSQKVQTVATPTEQKNPYLLKSADIQRDSKMDRSRPPTQLEGSIKEGNSDSEHEVEDLSNLNIRSYDEYMA